MILDETDGGRKGGREGVYIFPFDLRSSLPLVMMDDVPDPQKNNKKYAESKYDSSDTVLIV